MTRSTLAYIVRLMLGLSICPIGIGCGLSQSYPQKNTFALQAGTPQVTAQPPVVKQALRIRQMHLAKPYDEMAFIYQTGPSKFETDYYNAFIVVPDEMLTGDLVHWIEVANIFPAVVEPGGLSDYGFSLESSLTALYANYTNRKSPKAILEIKIYLLQEQSTGSSVRFQKAYCESEPIEANSPASLVAGWERAYRRILIAIVTDLRTNLATTVSTDR